MSPEIRGGGPFKGPFAEALGAPSAGVSSTKSQSPGATFHGSIGPQWPLSGGMSGIAGEIGRGRTSGGGEGGEGEERERCSGYEMGRVDRMGNMVVPDFQRSSPELRPPLHEFRRPSPDFRQSVPDFRRPVPDFRRSLPEFRRPSPDFRRPSPEFRGQSPDFQRQSSEFRRLSPASSSNEGLAWTVGSASAVENSEGLCRYGNDEKTGAAEGRGQGWRSATTSGEGTDVYSRTSVDGSSEDAATALCGLRSSDQTGPRHVEGLREGVAMETTRETQPSATDLPVRRGERSPATWHQEQQRRQQQYLQHHTDRDFPDGNNSRSVNSACDQWNPEEPSVMLYGRNDDCSGGGPHTTGIGTGGGVRSSGDGGIFHDEPNGLLQRNESFGGDNGGENGPWVREAKRKRRPSSPMFVGRFSVGTAVVGTAAGAASIAKCCNDDGIDDSDDTAPHHGDASNAGCNVLQARNVPHPRSLERNLFRISTSSSSDQEGRDGSRSGGSGRVGGEYCERRGGEVEENTRCCPSREATFSQQSGSFMASTTPELALQKRNMWDRADAVDSDEDGRSIGPQLPATDVIHSHARWSGRPAGAGISGLQVVSKSRESFYQAACAVSASGGGGSAGQGVGRGGSAGMNQSGGQRVVHPASYC